jgi:hypothetical protein
MADDASLNSALCTCLVARSRDGFPLEAPRLFALDLCQALISGNCPPHEVNWMHTEFWKEPRSCNVSKRKG